MKYYSAFSRKNAGQCREVGLNMDRSLSLLYSHILFLFLINKAYQTAHEGNQLPNGSIFSAHQVFVPFEVSTPG